MKRLCSLLLVIAFPTWSQAAISASCVWEVRTGGHADNGGGYVSGGTDYSLQDSAQLTVTDAAATGTTNLSSATGGFTSAMVGNIVCVAGQGRRQITAYVDGNNVTCDAAWGTFTGATARVGGAANLVASIDQDVPAGNTIFIKAGTFTRTATETITLSGTGAASIKVAGYDTNRTLLNTDTKPLFTSATNSVQIWTLNVTTYTTFYNIKCTSTATTRGRGWGNATAISSAVRWVNCEYDGTDYGWFASSSNNRIDRARFDNCTARNCATAGWFNGGNGSGSWCFFACSADTCGYGFAFGTASGASVFSWYNCIAFNCTIGWTSTANTGSTQPCYWLNCVAYGCTTGMSFAFTTGIPVGTDISNCIFYGNGTGVYCATSGQVDSILFVQSNNAFGGNSSADRTNVPSGAGDIALSASPFTNAAGGDFSLNSTAGGGAALKAAGYPAKVGSNTYTAATNYQDVGVAQAQCTGGAGGVSRSRVVNGGGL